MQIEILCNSHLKMDYLKVVYRHNLVIPEN